MAVTVKDIAAELGISYSTVAYALSGKGTIKEATRQKILAVSRQMGYVPNMYAKSFKGGRKPLIGIIVPNLIMGYNEVVQRIFMQSLDTGWDVQTAVSGFCPDNEARQVQRFLEMQADIIFLRSYFQTWEEVPEEHSLRLANSTKSNIIVWGNALRGSPFKAVKSDFKEQAKKILTHIHKCGYKHVTYAINTSLPMYINDAEFVDSLRAQFEELWGNERNLHILTHEDISEQLSTCEERIDNKNLLAGRLFFKKSSQRTKRSNALILQNDVCAIGAIHDAYAQGVCVGKALGIASLTCNIASALSPQSITTCDFMPEDVARLALEYCNDLSAKRGKTLVNRTVLPQLRIGQTLCE